MLWLMGFAIGAAAGLRSMAPLAIVAWAAQSWPGVRETPLAFMASPITAWILTAFAAAELVADKLPFIPSRLDPGPLGTRAVSGGLCAAVCCAAAHQSLVVGAVAGALGGLAGAFAGHRARRTLTHTAKLPDVPVALAEDAVAIGVALLVVSRV
jgi:uncharacterized membrane protein